MEPRYYLTASCSLPSGAWAKRLCAADNEAHGRELLATLHTAWPCGIVRGRQIHLCAALGRERWVIAGRDLD